MFKNTFQSGFLSILYSIGSKPLQIWDKKVRNGHIKRITDQDIQSFVLEIVGTNVSTTYITCPADPKKTLGIKLPYLVMIVKNMKKYFTFEVQVLDDKNVRRRFRASNYQSTTRVKPFICTMPMRLDEGWNQIQFNLADFTRQADILIAAIGKPAFVHEGMVKSGCTVVDVGINRVKDSQKKSGYRLVGDVDFDAVSPKCAHITPVPGGVGPMTVAMLMSNTIQAYRQLEGVDPS